jgi:hypothetical protein
MYAARGFASAAPSAVVPVSRISNITQPAKERERGRRGTRRRGGDATMGEPKAAAREGLRWAGARWRRASAGRGRGWRSAGLLPEDAARVRWAVRRRQACRTIGPVGRNDKWLHRLGLEWDCMGHHATKATGFRSQWAEGRGQRAERDDLPHQRPRTRRRGHECPRSTLDRQECLPHHVNTGGSRERLECQSGKCPMQDADKCLVRTGHYGTLWDIGGSAWVSECDPRDYCPAGITHRKPVWFVAESGLVFMRAATR